MKNYLYLLILIAFVNIDAQVAIDKLTVDGAGLLDFRSENSDLIAKPNMGLILPKVDALDSRSVPGTLYLNTISKEVEYLDNVGTINSLSSAYNTLLAVDSSLNETGQGVVISDGSISSLAPGVLVLESANKALILPKVTNPETTMVNPSPGMMVYDLDSKSIAVYSGENWCFWN